MYNTEEKLEQLLSKIERDNEISDILKQTQPYKLSITDINADKEVEFYVTEKIYDEIHTLLQTFYKKTDPTNEQPYILTQEDIAEKSPEELRDMLGLNPTVKYKDFIITTTQIHECEKNHHNIHKILIDLPIAQKNSNIVIKTINAYHCYECNLNFITNEDYKKIKEQGSMLCQHMTLSDYKEYIRNMESAFTHYNKESFLKRHGYSVSQQDALTDSERHSILSHIIELSALDKTGTIWNRDKIIWFLEHQIEMHPQPCYEKAREKWKKDLDFLNDYSHNNPIVYKIRTIIYK